MRNSVVKLLLSVLVAGGVGCGGPTDNRSGTTIIIECDVSHESNHGIVERYDPIQEGISIAVTRCDDPAIRQERLGMLLKQLQRNEPVLMKVLASQEEKWVFYVAHNVPEGKVAISFVGSSGVTVNGRTHAEPLALVAGAHGFVVEWRKPKVFVEHTPLPLNSSR